MAVWRRDCLRVSEPAIHPKGAIRLWMGLGTCFRSSWYLAACVCRSTRFVIRLFIGNLCQELRL